MTTEALPVTNFTNDYFATNSSLAIVSARPQRNTNKDRYRAQSTSPLAETTLLFSILNLGRISVEEKLSDWVRLMFTSEENFRNSWAVKTANRIIEALDSDP